MNDESHMIIIAESCSAERTMLTLSTVLIAVMIVAVTDCWRRRLRRRCYQWIPCIIKITFLSCYCFTYFLSIFIHC